MTRRLESFSRGERLGDYIYHRIVMDLFSRLPRHEMTEVPFSSIDDCVRDTGIDPRTIAHVKEAEMDVPGFAGRSCPVQVVEVEQSGRTAWIVRASIDSPLAVSFGTKAVITPTAEGHRTTTQSGITITDGVVFQDQQIHGVKVFERAMLAGRRSQPIVYATGTGKSFVLIAPAIANGKGIFVVPDEKQANQLRADILRLDLDITDADVATTNAVQAGSEAAAIAGYKHLIIKKDQLRRFLPYLHDQLMSIDEVHELASSDLEALISPEKNNVLQAVTATWTEPLQKILGDPLTEINMHFVLTKLKAFRKIHRNVMQFPPDLGLDARVFDMLVDYYGSVAYITDDNMPADETGAGRYLTLEWLRQPAARAFGLDSAISRIRAVDEVRRFDHMNMAFSKNLPLLMALTAAYQGVFDGSYKRLDELAAAVSHRRAVARITEELRLANTLVGVDLVGPVDPDADDIRTRFGGIIRASRIDGAGMQQEAGDVMKQQIANVITRHTVGLFSDNTPAAVIRAHEVQGTLPALLALYSGNPAHLDPHQRGFIERIRERHPGSVYDRIASALVSIDDRDRILSALAHGDFTALQVSRNSIDLRRFPEAQYATLVRPGDEQGAADAARRVNLGYHTHIIGDSELATGYSNPDIMSVQRVIEHVIPEGATRAAQIGGRATRDKDGVAFLSEYLGPRLDVHGTLGASGGRPFLFEDVMAPDYGKRVKQYRISIAADPTR